MSELIAEIYRTGQVMDAEGASHPVHSIIGQREGEFLGEVIHADPSIEKVLEIGLGYGLSALFIGYALANRPGQRHVILDPLQEELFDDIGLLYLQRAGFSHYEFHAEPSEYFLPAAAAQEPGSFDLVFVDGFHTFDHTMMDMFYAGRLIREGGYLVVDDCHHTSVAKAVSYVSQYPAYEIFSQSPPFQSAKGRVAQVVRTLLPGRLAGALLPGFMHDYFYLRTAFSRVVVLKKVAPDTRDWDWFKSF